MSEGLGGIIDITKAVLAGYMADAQLASLCERNPGYYRIFESASKEEARKIMVQNAKNNGRENIIPFPGVSLEIS